MLLKNAQKPLHFIVFGILGTDYRTPVEFKKTESRNWLLFNYRTNASAFLQLPSKLIADQIGRLSIWYSFCKNYKKFIVKDQRNKALPRAINLNYSQVRSANISNVGGVCSSNFTGTFKRKKVVQSDGGRSPGIREKWNGLWEIALTEGAQRTGKDFIRIKELLLHVVNFLQNGETKTAHEGGKCSHRAEMSTTF